MHDRETTRLARLHWVAIILLAIGVLATNVVRSVAERRQADRIDALESRVAALESKSAH